MLTRVGSLKAVPVNMTPRGSIGAALPARCRHEPERHRHRRVAGTGANR